MTDETFDPYAELGLGRAAAEFQVKEAHRKAAKQHHPDKGGDRDKFERITKAALILRDPEKRRRYDETGEVDDGPSQASQDQMAVISLADQLLQGAISKVDPDHDDVIAMAMVLGDKSIAHNRQLLTQATGERDQLKRLAKRLKHRGEGSDFLTGVMRDKVAKAEQEMRGIEKSIKLHQDAMDLLDSYAWEADERADQVDLYGTMSREQADRMTEHLDQMHRPSWLGD